MTSAVIPLPHPRPQDIIAFYSCGHCNLGSSFAESYFFGLGFLRFLLLIFNFISILQYMLLYLIQPFLVFCRRGGFKDNYSIIFGLTSIIQMK